MTQKIDGKDIIVTTLKNLEASDESAIKKLKKSKYNKKWYVNNKERRNIKSNEWYKNNKKRHNENCRKSKIIKKETDIGYRLLINLRRRVLLALQGKNKSEKTMILLGIPNVEFLKKHIESTFKPGMSWEKRHLIHIDHIIPCSLFDLSKPEEQAKCFHYTNLQALWAHENLSKSDKYTT